MQKLFEAAWQELYPGLIEWVGLSNGGALTSVDVGTMTLLDRFRQIHRRGRQRDPAAEGGPRGRPRRRCRPHRLVSGRSGDLRVEAAERTSTSSATPPSRARCRARLRQRIRRARICAAAIVALLAGRQAAPPTLISSCYSLIAPDYAISQTRHLSAGGRSICRGRRRRSISAAGCVPRVRARPKPRRRTTGSAHHRRGVRMMRGARLRLWSLQRARHAASAQEALRALRRSSAMPFRNR